MYGCKRWTIKKTEHWRIDTFELWCWGRLLRIPWTARRSNQSILKEISPGISLEGMMLPVPGILQERTLEWVALSFSNAWKWKVKVKLLSHDSSQPHGLQHARLPCPSPTPGACPNSCPSSQWCHPTSSSSVVPFSSCLQSFPASGSFPVSQFFASGGQNIRASASVLPMNIQDWFPEYFWISLQSKEPSRVFFNTIVQKHQFFGAQLFFYSPTLTSIHDYWKNHSFD